MLELNLLNNVQNTIQQLNNIIPKYAMARKNTMATLIINIERLNHEDFPYEWFKYRCINQANILKMPPELFIAYAMIASNYLIKKDNKNIENLGLLYTQRSMVRSRILQLICNIETERELEYKRDDIRYSPLEVVHELLEKNGLNMKKINNRRLLLDSLYAVMPIVSDEATERKRQIEIFKNYSNKKDTELIKYLSGLILPDEQGYFNDHMHKLNIMLRDVKETRNNIINFINTHHDFVPPNLIKNKNLRKLSDTSLLEIAISLDSFMNLHPDGKDSKNHNVAATIHVCCSKEKSE